MANTDTKSPETLLREAVTCLYLELPATIADDVRAKVDAVLAVLDERNARLKRITLLTEQDAVVQACVEEASREILGLVEDNDVDVDDGPQVERIVRDQILRALEHMSVECSNLFDLAAKYEGVFVDLKGDEHIDWLRVDGEPFSTPAGKCWYCKFCNTRSADRDGVEHDDECPIAIATAVYEENKEK